MNTPMPFTLATLLISFVGGIVWAAGAWTLNAWKIRRLQQKHESFTREWRARETLYEEFVNACATLLRDFLSDNLVAPDTLTSAMAALSRIRLTASKPVLKAAEAALQNIKQNYLNEAFQTLDEKTTRLRESLLDGTDPVSEFSRACRDELWELIPTFG
jgi:hypothetical protein